jgi:hypothetical protein
MAKKTKYGQLIAFVVLIIAIFVRCASTSSSSGGSYFTGTGGSGMSITILSPKGVGITEDQKRVIQGELIDNFTTYSKISTLDRMNLDDTYSEFLSGYYEDDNAGVADLGHMNPTQYIMYTTITKNSMGYTLQIQISRTSDKIMEASFSETCTSIELDNLTAIHRATLALLPRLGVELSERAKTALSKPSTTQQVNSQLALAKGIEAQRNGTVAEAMSYYYEAASYNSALTEAANRLSAISTNIRTGNIGVDARNRIEERNAWLRLMAQCGDYYLKHLPIEITYKSRLKQVNLNYGKGTVDLQFDILSYASDNIQMWNDILTGLRRTGKVEEWGFGDWPVGERHSHRSLIFRDSAIIYVLERKSYPNHRLRHDPDSFGRDDGSIDIHQLDIRNVDPSAVVTLDNGLIYGENVYKNGKYLRPIIRTFLDIVLINENGKIVSRLSFQLANYFHRTGNSVRIDSNNYTVAFRDVNAYDITDRLTIKILSVNGIPAEEATQSGYVRIIAAE